MLCRKLKEENSEKIRYGNDENTGPSFLKDAALVKRYLSHFLAALIKPFNQSPVFVSVHPELVTGSARHMVQPYI